MMAKADTIDTRRLFVGSTFLWKELPGKLAAPVPLPLLQPVLRVLVSRIAHRRPQLFARLGSCCHKRYLIDPLNLPFVLLLSPDPAQPSLKACRRSWRVPHDARIAGTFLILLDMVDGRLDGDALFFSRDLIVEGDTEAIVALRNALDDMEGSILDDIADLFGLPVRMALVGLRRVRGAS